MINFIQLAAHAYDNPQCKTLEEFNSDVFKFTNVKKMMGKETINTHLVLNNLVVLYNVFERQACTILLFDKIPKKNWPQLKTFLVYLNYMPDHIPELNINSVEIPLCSKIIDDLRQI